MMEVEKLKSKHINAFFDSVPHEKVSIEFALNELETVKKLVVKHGHAYAFIEERMSQLKDFIK